jgi:hypothetical protein
VLANLRIVVDLQRQRDQRLLRARARERAHAAIAPSVGHLAPAARIHRAASAADVPVMLVAAYRRQRAAASRIELRTRPCGEALVRVLRSSTGPPDDPVMRSITWRDDAAVDAADFERHVVGADSPPRTQHWDPGFAPLVAIRCRGHARTTWRRCA